MVRLLVRWPQVKWPRFPNSSCSLSWAQRWDRPWWNVKQVHFHLLWVLPSHSLPATPTLPTARMHLPRVQNVSAAWGVENVLSAAPPSQAPPGIVSFPHLPQRLSWDLPGWPGRTGNLQQWSVGDLEAVIFQARKNGLSKVSAAITLHHKRPPRPLNSPP